jgi:cytochrome c oxidase cbb3-type subunit 3
MEIFNTSYLQAFINDSLAMSLLATLVVFAIILSYLGNVYHQITKGKLPEVYVERKPKVKNKEVTSSVIAVLTDTVPIEREQEIMMDHEYDGIRELDNNLPPWWVWGFYVCIAWAVMYLVHYHIFELGDSSAQEYQKEMITADAENRAFLAKGGSRVTGDNVEYLSDAMSLAKGESIYQGNCKTCHGNAAQGDVGPNLTDKFWKHGGTIQARFLIIDKGFGAMPKWGDKLSGKDIQMVLSYLKSIEGSNPPNAREPEGEEYKEEL